MKTNIEYKILPRDYGIGISEGRRQIFFSPFKYAMAKVFLENSEDFTKRIKRFNIDSNLRDQNLKRDLLEGIRKKESSVYLVRRNPIEEVSIYGNNYVSKIRSKNGEDRYLTSIKRSRQDGSLLGPNAINCNCQDALWGRTKGNDTGVVCTHLATLNTALTMDYRNKTRTLDSYTGLYPRERFDLALPFDFYSGGDKDFLVTKALVDYYLEGRSIYEINRDLLLGFDVFSEELYEEYKKRDFGFSFQVLRQKKKENKDLSESQKRYIGSINRLNQRLENKLVSELGFKFEGYSVEFKGTESETIGKRFRKGYEVYSICNLGYKPPVLIRKLLDDKSNISSLNSGIKGAQNVLVDRDFETLDDFTRRNALTRVIIPNPEKVFVPKLLQVEYRKMRSGY